MNCSSLIRDILVEHGIDGHDRPGGTDKNTSHTYVEIYGELLGPIRSKYGSLLEIGVQYGGSSLLWQELLPNFRLCCVDTTNKIEPTLFSKFNPRTQFHFLDAYSNDGVEKIRNLHPGGFDVIIDDGPHTEQSQIDCIKLYLDLLKVNGMMIIEDIQAFDSVYALKKSIPESDLYDYNLTVYDHRDKKGRYDDVVFLIEKKEKVQKTKIAVFYHVGQMGQWQRLYQEQINSLVISGLYQAAEFIHVGINGNDPLPSTLPKIKSVVNKDHILEADTLKALWDFCTQNPDYRVMYFHTKGATQENTSNRYNVDAWRLYLEYFVIHQWKKCLPLLKQYDCVGTEYSYETGLIDKNSGQTVWENNMHYAGNYWWANASYISKLDPNYLYNTDRGWTRYRSEFWIGTGNPNKYNFYQTTIFDKYSHSPYTPVDYVFKESFKEPEPITIQESQMLKNKKSKFVMITMFKNEAGTIGRMLESCYKYIDYYIIQDNGSTDGTPEVVENFFKDKNIPGFVYKVEEGWIGFGWNRDHLLQKCLNTDHGCDWILKMDCDEILQVSDDFDWSVFDDKNLHSFHVPSQSGSTIYNRAWIWNARLKWKFNHDTSHETIVLLDNNIGENFRRFDLPLSFKMIGFDDGESWQSRTKYVSDALKLEEKLIREDTMLKDLYHFWYVGKSYYDCFRETSLPLKQSHSDEFARRCIFNFKEFINYTHNYHNTGRADRIDEMGYYAMMCIGNSYKFLKDYENAIQYLKAADQFCPQRNEHLVCLAETYQEIGDFSKMLELTTFLNSTTRNNPFPRFTFIIDSNCYADTGNYVKQLHNFASVNNNSGAMNVNQNLITVNKDYNNRLWVVDNFYTDPDKVRDFALSVEFAEDKEWYKGARSKQQYNFPGIQKTFEKIMNRKLKDLNTHGMCGRFQICTSQEDLVYHVDGQQWAAVLFLTPDAPIEAGTCLLKSKITGARHSLDKDCDKSFVGGFYDKTKFEVVDVVGNVYNRIVIFDARCIHAASQYFGNELHNSRLTHLFFFEDA